MNVIYGWFTDTGQITQATFQNKDEVLPAYYLHHEYKTR